jgi:putative addiction module component (TIGR02574 family)
MSPTLESELRALSPAERILLVEEIWDHIAAEPASVPLSTEHRAELDRRLDALDKAPDPGRPWSEVRTELLGR